MHLNDEQSFGVKSRFEKINFHTLEPSIEIIR